MVLGLGDSAGGGEGGGEGGKVMINELELRHGWLESILCQPPHQHHPPHKHINTLRSPAAPPNIKIRQNNKHYPTDGITSLLFEPSMQ